MNEWSDGQRTADGGENILHIIAIVSFLRSPAAQTVFPPAAQQPNPNPNPPFKPTRNSLSYLPHAHSTRQTSPTCALPKHQYRSLLRPLPPKPISILSDARDATKMQADGGQKFGWHPICDTRTDYKLYSLVNRLYVNGVFNWWAVEEGDRSILHLSRHNQYRRMNY